MRIVGAQIVDEKLVFTLQYRSCMHPAHQHGYISEDFLASVPFRYFDSVGWST